GQRADEKLVLHPTARVGLRPDHLGGARGKRRPGHLDPALFEEAADLGEIVYLEGDVLDASKLIRGQPPSTGLLIAHVDEFDARVATRVVERGAFVALVRTRELQAERLQLLHVPLQALDDNSDVVDPLQLHTSTFPPSASACSHASATARVRAASAGEQATNSGSPASTAARNRAIDRVIGSVNSPAG